MQNRKDAIHISSFDFDGCMLPESLDLDDQKPLLDALKAQNNGFKVNIGMVGSNRQDKRIDDLNQNGQGPVASAFHTLPNVYRDCNIEFDPVLLADVYARRAQGSAYKYASNAQLDPSTFHPQYIFDEFKGSLLYFQIHQAAMNARACDFIVIEDESCLKNLSKRSNAAYVYCQNSKKLFYINSMQSGHFEEKNPPENIIQFIELIESVNIQQNRSCFERNNTFGFQLNNEDLNSFDHAQIDYPIYFDFYDDRADILAFLTELFEKNTALLPSNVVLRLHQYDVTNNDSRKWLLDMNTQSIQGTGLINPNLADTLNQFARKVHGISTEEIRFVSLDAKVLSCAMSDSKNQSKLLEAQCIKVYQKEQDEQFGLIQDYSSKKSIASLIEFQRKLNASKETQWAFFDANKQYSDLEQRKAISELIACLNQENKAALSAHLIPVLKHGPLGQLIHDLQINLDQQPLRDVNQTALHQALNAYKVQRQERCVLDYFNPIFKGYAKYAKFAAVDAILIATKDSTGALEVHEKHKDVLTQGQLAETLKSNQVQLSFINDRKQALACLSYSFIDTKPRVNKVQKIGELIDSRFLKNDERAAGLVVAFAISTKSWFSDGKNFGDTTSMHRFCLALLKPNTFSDSLRQAVFKLAKLNESERQLLQTLASTPLEFTACLWDSSERCKAAGLLRQKLLDNMQNIVETAMPVFHLQEKLSETEDYNLTLGQKLGFR